MRKLPVITVAVAAMLMVSCKDKTEQTIQENLVDSTNLVTMSREELEATLMTQDTLISLVNDISADMIQLKNIEMIVSSPAGLNGETPSQRQQILNDMAAVKQTLAERRNRLAELEKKLKDNSQENSVLLKTIENLKAQIEQNEVTIQSLTKQLADANVQIKTLNVAVDSLNTTVATEKAGKEKAQAEASNLTTELNTCYYAIGSKKELETHNIIQTGFLRKTKILQGDYQMSYFTAIDKRTSPTIQTYSKKAKVLTNQPKDSYVIKDDAKGMKVLEITNPTRFWEASNFLVIQTN
ncbi:MAG: hypothetical protein NC338_05360 [Firmicutes bacterium]|nr:hypothetical protein [Bacillota bacterium]MCM1400824.1 hypothetical protein [Bacteroides sp.]